MNTGGLYGVFGLIYPTFWSIRGSASGSDRGKVIFFRRFVRRVRIDGSRGPFLPWALTANGSQCVTIVAQGTTAPKCRTNLFPSIVMFTTNAMCLQNRQGGGRRAIVLLLGFGDHDGAKAFLEPLTQRWWCGGTRRWRQSVIALALPVGTILRVRPAEFRQMRNHLLLENLAEKRTVRFARAFGRWYSGIGGISHVEP